MRSGGLVAARAPGRRFPAAIGAAIALAWITALLVWVTGHERLLNHDTLIEGGLQYWAALGIFLVAWQFMIVAMMMPSSYPLIRLFGRLAANQSRPVPVRAALLGGYLVIWTGFGVIAFVGDTGVHWTADHWRWLNAHSWLIAGFTLLLAGVFQSSSLKDRCLRECRNPGVFLLRHYRRGAIEAFRLGRRHGLFCVGCCWALMLVMFAAGVASLWWMAALASVMFYEKVGRTGDRVVPVVGLPKFHGTRDNLRAEPGSRQPRGADIADSPRPLEDEIL
jgi:predicted metal-binding membrane protein